MPNEFQIEIIDRLSKNTRIEIWIKLLSVNSQLKEQVFQIIFSY